MGGRTRLDLVRNAPFDMWTVSIERLVLEDIASDSVGYGGKVAVWGG